MWSNWWFLHYDNYFLYITRAQQVTSVLVCWMSRFHGTTFHWFCCFDYLLPVCQVTDTPPVPEEQFLVPTSQTGETDNASSVPSLNLSLNMEFEPMETISQDTVKEAEEAEETVIPRSKLPPVVPAFFPGYLPVPFPFWPPNAAPAEEEKESESSHQVLKPIPVLPKEPVNVDELVGMSQLSLGEINNGHIDSSPLSLKLLGAPSRQSAFHTNTSVGGSELGKGKNSVVQAVWSGKKGGVLSLCEIFILYYSSFKAIILFCLTFL